MDTLFDLSSFIIQAINFAIVALVLRAFLFKPYIKFLDEEAKKRDLLETQFAESEAILEKAKHEAHDIVDAARAEGKKISGDIVENARSEASHILADAHAEADALREKSFAQLELERKNISEELKSKVLDVAISLNEKLFGKNEANVDFLRKNATGIKF